MAVFTAIEAGVVSPDVPALNTVAALPHPLCFRFLNMTPLAPPRMSRVIQPEEWIP